MFAALVGAGLLTMLLTTVWLEAKHEGSWLLSVYVWTAIWCAAIWFSNNVSSGAAYV
jgi:hypothetical protein